jgi:quercetin dioxygenase-like cupin family protein
LELIHRARDNLMLGLHWSGNMDAKPLPGVSLKILQQMDGPIPGYVTVIVELKVAAGTVVGRHLHPGIESTYVVEGEAELTIDGQPPRVLRGGEAFQVPPNTVHSVKIGDKNAKACSSLVVEKGKPLVIPA